MIIYITLSEKDKIIELEKDYSNNPEMMSFWLEKLLGKHPWKAIASVCEARFRICDKIPKSGRIEYERGDIEHPISSLVF